MKELYANTWAEFDQDVRVFLLAGEERALLIDTGMPGLDLHQLISQHTDLPCQLLVTHADMDHISGNDQFDEFYMHPSEAAFYFNGQHGPGRMLPVFEGDTIDLGGRVLEIIHLPGHTPGSITVLDRASRCLIGGDPISREADIYMYEDHCDMNAYIASLERLDARDDFDWIYPSHGVEKIGRDVIPLLIDAAKKIVAGELDGEVIEMYGETIRRIDIGIGGFLCALED